MQDGLLRDFGDKTILASGAGRSADVLLAYGFKKVISVDDYARCHPTMWPFKRYEPLPAGHVAAAGPIDAVIVVCDPAE